jgi:hypothetical protein
LDNIHFCSVFKGLSIDENQNLITAYIDKLLSKH